MTARAPARSLGQEVTGGRGMSLRAALGADERGRGAGGVFEEVVDAADEVALEAADRLLLVLPRARCLAM